MTSEITLGELAIKIHQFERRIDQGITRGLRDASTSLLSRVQQTFGYYQDGAGPFPTWAEISPNTRYRKGRPSGFPSWGELPDAPLVRTGDLAMSYKMEVDGHEATIGSDSEYALIHETGGWSGKAYIPQRSTLGLTFVKFERKTFARFNSSAWYTVMDTFGIRSVIHDTDEFAESSDLSDFEVD